MSNSDLEARKAALERYNEAFNRAHGYYPGVTSIKRGKPAGSGRQAGVVPSTRLPKETPEQQRERVLKTYNLRPLREVPAPPLDVTDPGRYQRPPAFRHPAGVPLAKNVRRNGDDAEEQGIEPEEFRQWRTEYMGMTPEQLGVLLRVTPRTIRNWEAGKSPIPFMLYWAMQHLKPTDLPTGHDPKQPTRYYKPAILDHGQRQLENLLQRYSHVMKAQGVTAGDFQRWRRDFMLMTPAQMGQFLRVPVKTIQAWEDGLQAIPFSVWWVMHTLMQDPDVFLSRPGFHDLCIEYQDGEALLCSKRYPAMRFSYTDLYLAKSAIQNAVDMNRELSKRDREIEELQAENIRLRKMMKAGTVSAELKAMHDHIGNLMKQIHTADVVDLRDQGEPGEVIPLKQASA